MNKFLEKKYKLQTNGTWLSFIKTIQNGFQYQNRQKVNPFRYEYHFTTVGIWYFLSKLLQERPCNTKSSPVTFKNQGQCLFCFDVNLVYNCVQRFWLKKKSVISANFWSIIVFPECKRHFREVTNQSSNHTYIAPFRLNFVAKY